MQTPSVHPSSIVEDLRVLQDKRIYFGHQSVGENVVEGIRDILRDHPEVRLNVVRLRDGAALPDAYFAESAIGENRQPERKCADFRRAVDSSLLAQLDVALMKFCYADIQPDTDVDAVFTMYRETIDAVRGAHPGLRIVHVTVPLTPPTAAWKRFVGGILGKAGHNDLANVRRHLFNERLRQHYAGEPIFDLALIEATRADGSLESFRHEHGVYYALASDNAPEGDSHLNEAGRRRAAAELLRTLAAAVTR